MGEDLLFHWAKVYNMNVCSLRLFNVYGTRSRTSGTYGAVFGVFLAQKIAAKSLTVVGDGKQSRDFTYVSDVCDAFIRAGNSKKSKNKIYNVGSGIDTSVNHLVKLLGGKKVYIPDLLDNYRLPNLVFDNLEKMKQFIFNIEKNKLIATEYGFKSHEKIIRVNNLI